MKCHGFETARSLVEQADRAKGSWQLLKTPKKN